MCIYVYICVYLYILRFYESICSLIPFIENSNLYILRFNSKLPLPLLSG